VFDVLKHIAIGPRGVIEARIPKLEDLERAHNVAHLADVIRMRMRCYDQINLLHTKLVQQFNSRSAAIPRIDQDCFAVGQLYQLRIALTDIEEMNYKFPGNRTRLRPIVPLPSKPNDRDQCDCEQRYDDD